MHINFVEIQNFRKLKSCRVEFTNRTTLFVGANNSGKTSAMDALVKFLIRKEKLSTNDFTLSNWEGINNIGRQWESDAQENGSSALCEKELYQFLPVLDVWLQVKESEIHYVAHLIPTLDWEGGLLGVRLRFEPEKLEDLYKEYRLARAAAKSTVDEAKVRTGKGVSLELWPRNLRDFLDKKLDACFTIRAYLLDPLKCEQPDSNGARPQDQPESEFIEGDPFKGLVRIHNVKAQRGFSDPDSNTDSSEENISSSRKKGMLSSQLKKYYHKHLNPLESPDPSDIEALEAIETAQESFKNRLHEGFKNPISELENLGYPGFSDPRITISPKIKPMDSIDHDSAVQFDLTNDNAEESNSLYKLPENYNGLGYQNLISIVFHLMQFRDEWMRVGKIGKQTDLSFIEPLHLVLVEEPEAHLHVQVQQVFIRKAYRILRNNERLGENNQFETQLVISTHSSHIAHGVDDFACLRYFRRRPAKNKNAVPISTVSNLSEVFGKEDETKRFVTRYLQTTHCDLFFADAAILVEGPAERMLVPHFINQSFEQLNDRYISLLEIGGSHAHRLRGLIERLELTTLIITDLDVIDPSKNGQSVIPGRDKGYETDNYTLKSWVPGKVKMDEVLKVNFSDKVKHYNEWFSVRVAYQYPVQVNFTEQNEEVIANTFEDALVYENLCLFKHLEGTGLVNKFHTAINESKSVDELKTALFNALGKNAKKAEFALELLFTKDPTTLKVPMYISEGLSWLQEQLQRKSGF